MAIIRPRAKAAAIRFRIAKEAEARAHIAKEGVGVHADSQNQSQSSFPGPYCPSGKASEDGGHDHSHGRACRLSRPGSIDDVGHG